MKTSSSHLPNILSARTASGDHDPSKQQSINRAEPEWQKNTLRICGNWSEQLSSKGKIYFYNCITEVSQWQKPVEWTLPDMAQSELQKIISDRRGEVKRAYSSTNQSGKVRTRSLNTAPSPKRQKYYNGIKKPSERSRVENSTISRADQSIAHRDSPKKLDPIAHEASQRLESSRESVSISTNTSKLANAIENCKTINSTIEPPGLKCLTKVIFTDTPHDKPPDKIESEQLVAHPTPNPSNVVSKLASILSSQSNQSPLKAATSSGNSGNSDPQLSSTSRSSSPLSSRNEHARISILQDQRLSEHSLQPHSSSSISTDSSLHESAFSKEVSKNDSSNSPQPTNLIKPDQVLRNLVSVLSHVVDRRDRLCTSNSVGTNPTVTSNPHLNIQQSSVANVLSSIFGTPTNPPNGRLLPNTSSAVHRPALNGLDKLKAPFTPCCPPSSDGNSVVASPACARSSPSPGIDRTSSSRIHTPKRPSPLHPPVSTSDSIDQRNFHTSDCETLPSSTALVDNRNKPLKLENPELLEFVDTALTTRFQHPLADSLENEAQLELRNFDCLQSVLYSELSGELKKLRALVAISETKLQIHRKRKKSLQELMDTIESKRVLPLLSSPDQTV